MQSHQVRISFDHHTDMGQAGVIVMNGPSHETDTGPNDESQCCRPSKCSRGDCGSKSEDSLVFVIAMHEALDVSVDIKLHTLVWSQQ